MTTLREHECLNCAAPLPASPDVPGGVICEHCGCRVEGGVRPRLELATERADGGRGVVAAFRRYAPWGIAPILGATAAPLIARFLSGHRTPYLIGSAFLFALPGVLLLRLSGRRMAAVAVALVAGLILIAKPFAFPLTDQRHGPFAYRLWEEFHGPGLVALAVAAVLLARIPRRGWRLHLRLLEPRPASVLLFAAGLGIGALVVKGEFLRPPPPDTDAPTLSRGFGRHVIPVDHEKGWPIGLRRVVRRSVIDISRDGRLPRYHLEVALYNAGRRARRVERIPVDFLDRNGERRGSEEAKGSGLWLRPGDSGLFTVQALHVETWLARVRLRRPEEKTRPGTGAYAPSLQVKLRWRVERLPGLNLRLEAETPRRGSPSGEQRIVVHNTGRRGIRKLVLRYPTRAVKGTERRFERWEAVAPHQPVLQASERRILRFDPPYGWRIAPGPFEVDALWLHPEERKTKRRPATRVGHPAR